MPGAAIGKARDNTRDKGAPVAPKGAGGVWPLEDPHTNPEAPPRRGWHRALPDPLRGGVAEGRGGLPRRVVPAAPGAP